MNTYLMEMDAKARYEEFRHEADMHRLAKRLKAQRPARMIALKLSLGGILRRFIASRRLLKPQV